MREILHKGKRVDTQEWIEGFFVIEEYGSPTDVRPAIIPVKENGSGLWGKKSESDYDTYEIDPKTFCQCTGFMTNKNNKKGKRIWENDIVEVIWCSGGIERYLIWWSREMCMMQAISLKNIHFNGCDYWDEECTEYSTFCFMMQDPWGHIKEVKVIGNIFDNPELIKNET